MYAISFENFIEETWDYVSEYVVSDAYWEQNEEFIRTLTHDMYIQYKKGLRKTEDNYIIETLTPKMCGRIIELFFKNLKEFKVLNVKL